MAEGSGASTGGAAWCAGGAGVAGADGSGGSGAWLSIISTSRPLRMVMSRSRGTNPSASACTR